MALYKQAQTILTNDAAYLPLRYTVVTNEVQPYIGGLQIDRDGLAGCQVTCSPRLFSQEALIACGDQ